MAATLAEIQELLAGEVGVPAGAAQVFFNLSFSLREIRQYVATTARDARSPFGSVLRQQLDDELTEYGRQQGLLPGGDAVRKHGCVVTAVLTMQEQDAVVAEVGGLASVVFKPSARVHYSSHGVAYAVRKVHGSVLRRMVPSGCKVLEVGANVPSMAVAAVEPSVYHGCCPVLSPRDAVRHSVDGRLRGLATDTKQRPATRACAAEMLKWPEKYYCRHSVQECSWKTEFIVSNEACHDIDMDDIPSIMAKHGARVWYGFRARAVGHGRAGEAAVAARSAVGFRWIVDKQADVIRFQFDSSTAFGYSHRWSSWAKFESRVTYRWQGTGFDYVFARMPGTTESSLFWAVFRVPVSRALYREVGCASTGLEGQVSVRSFRPVRSLRDREVILGFEPHEFRMERLALDKVVEQRMSLGDKGHLVTTMSYMRSIRVLFYVNGMPVSVEHRVAETLLESAAVAAELLAVQWRTIGRMESKMRMEVMAGDFSGYGTGAWGLSSFLGRVAGWLGRGAYVERLRAALEAFVARRAELPLVTVEPCDAYDYWETGDGEAGPLEVTAEGLTGCSCAELAEVVSALEYPGLGVAERDTLMVYRSKLQAMRSPSCAACSGSTWLDVPVSECRTAVAAGMASDSGYESESSDSQDEYVDALETQPGGQTRPVVKVEAAREAGPGLEVEAVKEYAAWGDHSEDCARSTAVEHASVLFAGGEPPTAQMLERASTGRTKHATVVVTKGYLGRAAGPAAGKEPALVCLPGTSKLVPVFSRKRAAGTQLVLPAAAPDGLYYYNTDLLIVNGRLLAAAARRTLEVPSAASELWYVNGPFGCGKTREIVRVVKKLREEQGPAGVLYLTAGSASAGRVRADLGDEASTRHVRTTDSYLMHGSRDGGSPSAENEVVYSTVVVDEMPMHHFGEVVAAIRRSGATKAVCFGDVNQITFQTFSATFRASHALCLRGFQTVAMSVVHRCRVDVLAAWQDRYGGTLRACACCAAVRASDESLEVVRIRSVADVPRIEGARMAAFTHVELAKLAAHFGESASAEVLRARRDGFATPHEDQGETYEVLQLVRLEARWNRVASVYSPSIYNRVQHALTSMSRHRARFIYYTVSDEVDEVVHRVALSKCPYRRQVARGEATWEEVKGLAAVARVADESAPSLPTGEFARPYSASEVFAL